MDRDGGDFGFVAPSSSNELQGRGTVEAGVGVNHRECPSAAMRAVPYVRWQCDKRPLGRPDPQRSPASPLRWVSRYGSAGRARRPRFAAPIGDEAEVGSDDLLVPNVSLAIPIDVERPIACRNKCRVQAIDQSVVIDVARHAQGQVIVAGAGSANCQLIQALPIEGEQGDELVVGELEGQGGQAADGRRLGDER